MKKEATQEERQDTIRNMPIREGKEEKDVLLQELEEKNKEQNKELQNKELIDTLKRVQADYENYRKRVERDNKEYRQYATQALIIKLLPVLDNFELTLSNKLSLPNKDSDKENRDAFVKGIELAYAEFQTILEQEGLRKINATGQHFDPALHEALLTEEHEGDKDIVLEEFQNGYMLHNKVMRPAKVKISKQKSNG